MSHPSWVRGLKLVGKSIVTTTNKSHPSWVRGLKPIIITWDITDTTSHPSWVRGLKPKINRGAFLLSCRTPRGCVD